MEGIEILKSTEIMAKPEWVIPFLVIGGLIGFILFLFYCATAQTNQWLLYFAVIFSIIALTAFGYFIFSTPIPTGTYEYDIKVSDNTPFNEFYQKYEILENYNYSNVYKVKERIIK